MVIGRALASALIVSLAALPACSSSSCVDSLAVNERLGDAEYHLNALTAFLKSDSPDFTKVSQEQGLLFYALVDVSNGLRHTAPAASNGYQDAAQGFQSVNAKNIPKLRLAAQELPATLQGLYQQLQQEGEPCNVS